MNTFKKNSYRRGLVTILNVVIIGGFLLGVMAIVYRASIRTMDGQRSVQMKLDYETREQAFLRSVVTLAPVYAANSMMDNSSGSTIASFNSMYTQAMDWSHMGQARTDAENTAMGFANIRNGNTADSSNPATLTVADVIGGLNGAAGGVTPSGVGAADQTGLPTPLSTRVDSVTAASQTAPLISSDITYNSASNSGDDRDFGLLNYPDIHFGYTDGQFIARQNWWELDIHANQKDRWITGVGNAGLDTNSYVLSLYEIPSQLAISSSAITNLGEINGSAYGSNISISGKVYAKKANVKGGSYDGLTTTTGVDFSGAASVGGNSIASGTDSSQTRDNATAFEAANTAAYYPISRASDYARSLFLPINPGLEFFDSFATTTTTQATGNRLSRESWNEYTRGCHQCRMKMVILEMDANQVPLAFSFTYVDNFTKQDIATPIIVHKATSSYSGGVNWVENATFPFITTQTADGGPSIDIYINNLVTWLQGIDASVDFSLNHSLLVNLDYVGGINVVQPSDPTLDSDFAIGIQGASDLTAFTKGFSLVSNSRLYVLDDLNTTPTASGSPAYPPLSIFTPAIRFGDGGVGSQIVVDGQIGSLSRSGSGIDILDLKKAGSGAADPASIKATLTSLTSLNELPPVNVMNWLVVVQKQ